MAREAVGSPAGPRQARGEKLQAQALLAVLTVLLLAALHQGAVALGWLAIADEPGEGAAGGGLVFAVALAALLGGSVLLALGSERVAGIGARVELAAAAFVLARFFTFDPYYAPTERRMSDNGLVPPAWIAALAVTAVAAALLSGRRPRAGLLLGGAVLALCAVTALLEAAGH